MKITRIFVTCYFSDWLSHCNLVVSPLVVVSERKYSTQNMILCTARAIYTKRIYLLFLIDPSWRPGLWNSWLLAYTVFFMLWDVLETWLILGLSKLSEIVQVGCSKCHPQVINSAVTVTQKCTSCLSSAIVTTTKVTCFKCFLQKNYSVTQQ